MCKILCVKISFFGIILFAENAEKLYHERPPLQSLLYYLYNNYLGFYIGKIIYICFIREFCYYTDDFKFYKAKN